LHRLDNEESSLYSLSRHQDNTETDITERTSHKRARVSGSSNSRSPPSSRFSVESDSGETVQENILSYVSHEKDNKSGRNIVQHLLAHEKISDPSAAGTNRSRRASLAPFATDFDNTPTHAVAAAQETIAHHHVAGIYPALPPRDLNHVTHKEPIMRQDENVIFDDVPPPPGTIVLSNAVKRKVKNQKNYLVMRFFIIAFLLFRIGQRWI